MIEEQSGVVGLYFSSWTQPLHLLLLSLTHCSISYQPFTLYNFVPSLSTSRVSPLSRVPCPGICEGGYTCAGAGQQPHQRDLLTQETAALSGMY